MKIAIFNPYKKIYAAENSVDAFYEQITKVNNIDVNIRSFCSTDEIVDFNPGVCTISFFSYTQILSSTHLCYI